MIGKLSILEERELPIPLSNLAVCSPNWSGASGTRESGAPAATVADIGPAFIVLSAASPLVGEPAGRPGRGGKALMGLRNRRRGDQPFYCLDCHPELGRGLAVLEEMGG